MLEVEMKFAGVDFTAVERQLLSLGAHGDPPRRDEDHYLNAPDRDFARTDEALRLRRIGANNFITYKGPKRDSETKTRLEIEVSVSSGDQTAADLLRLWTQLGYRSVAIVRKQRRVFHLCQGGFPVEVTLDEVDGLGRFAELEIQAEEDRLAAARDVLLRLAAILGLTLNERRSYLEMLLERPASSSSAKG